MADRIVDHSKFFDFKDIIPKSKISNSMIVRFNYQKNVHNKRPLLFVIEIRNGKVNGFNLNYLHEYKVQMLLKEIDEGKTKDFTNYDFYKHSYRTYNIDKIGIVRLGEYKRRDEEKEKENTNKKADEVDNKLKDITGEDDN